MKNGLATQENRRWYFFAKTNTQSPMFSSVRKNNCHRRGEALGRPLGILYFREGLWK